MSIARRELLLAEFGTWGYDERGWGPATREKYAWVVRELETWLQVSRKKSVLWANAKDLKAWLFAKPPNARTRNYYRQVCVAFWGFLVDHGYVETNHALALPRIPSPRTLPDVLTTEQAYAVEQVAKLRGLMFESLVSLYLYQAMRKSAVRTLQWPSLDLSAGWMRFDSKNKERNLPIHKKPLDVLKRWRDDCPDPRYVFPSPYPTKVGKPVSDTYVRNHIRSIGDEAQIEGLHPHTLRHTCATRLLKKGVDVMVVKEFLGHESLQTTQIYLHVFSADLKGAMERLDYDADEE